MAALSRRCRLCSVHHRLLRRIGQRLGFDLIEIVAGNDVALRALHIEVGGQLGTEARQNSLVVQVVQICAVVQHLRHGRANQQRILRRPGARKVAQHAHLQRQAVLMLARYRHSRRAHRLPVARAPPAEPPPANAAPPRAVPAAAAPGPPLRNRRRAPRPALRRRSGASCPSAKACPARSHILGQRTDRRASAP